MINVKKLYNQIFSDERITTLIPEDNIFNSYPDEIENFPCIVFVDENQRDSEYNENMPGASYCVLMVHIFSKKLDGYISTSEVAVVISKVFNEKLWNCSQNKEVADPDPNAEHRVMVFEKSIFELK